MKTRIFAVVALSLFATACSSIEYATTSRPTGSAEYTGNRQALASWSINCSKVSRPLPTTYGMYFRAR